MRVERSNVINMPGIGEIGINDRQVQRIWSIRNHAASIGANTEYQYFQVNATDETTRRRTNVTNPGRIPYRWFLCQNIGVVYSSITTVADAQLIQNGALLQFYKNNVLLVEAPVYEFHAGAGLSGVTQVSTEEIVNNGIPSLQAVMYLGDQSISILPEDVLKVSILYPAAVTLSAATLVEVILRGLGERPVN